MRKLLAAALAALSLVGSAWADQVLGPGWIDNAGKVLLPGGPTLGKWQGGRYNATPDILTLPSTDLGSTGNVSGMSVTLPSNITRRLADKLGERKSIADYALPADNGDAAPAIERAAAAGVKEINLLGGTVTTLKRTVNLPNGSISIRGDGVKTAEIRLAGANDIFFNVGNSLTMSYNFNLDNVLLTKEQVSSAGAVIKATNLYLWGFNRSRVFGDEKIWRVIDCVSCGELTSRDIKVENILEKALYVTCGTAPPGNPGGQCFDFIIDNWYTYGTNSASTDPANDGPFFFEDNFQAVRILNPTTGRHRGYAYYFKGTVANRGNNVLNFVVNPNVESSFVPSGTAYLGAVASTQIGGSVSWVTGTGGPGGSDFPAIKLSADAQTNTIRGMQIGVAKAGGIAIEDDGIRNRIQDIEAVGYDAAVKTAFLLGSTSRKGTYERLSISQFPRVFYDNSPDTAGHKISDVTYDAASGSPFVGLVGSINDNKVIKGITNLDAGAPSVSASGTLSLPDKGDTFAVDTAGAINAITPTYFGRRVTLLLAQSGTSLHDIRSGLGTGAFFLSKPLPATADGRTRITLQWRGDYWWEIARVP